MSNWKGVFHEAQGFAFPEKSRTEMNSERMIEMPSEFDEAVNRHTGQLIIAIGEGKFRDAVAQLVHAERKAAYQCGYDAAQNDVQPQEAQRPAPQPQRAPQAATTQNRPQSNGVPNCPKCNGPMWDNRKDKKNPRAPDFKCKDKQNCDGAIWIDNTGPSTADYAKGLTDGYSDALGYGNEEELEYIQ